MSADDVFKLMCRVVSVITGIETFEAFDARPASERPDSAYITLSLHKIIPVAMPTMSQKRVDDHLETTTIVASELEFNLTVHRSSRAMNATSAIHSINVNEQTKKLLFDAGVSVWFIRKHERDVQKVNQSYEDSAELSIIVAADLTTIEIINYADKVDFSVNNLNGSTEPKEGI